MVINTSLKLIFACVATFAVTILIVDSCHTNPAFGQRRNLPELTPTSCQCENLAKEFTYKGHTIVRFDCSGNYLAIHIEELYPKCNK